MKSLGEAYEPTRFEWRDPRRVYGGSTLLVAGGLAVLSAIFLVATVGDAAIAQKAWAGVLAGLGVPAMLLGVVLVLPTSRRKRVGVLVGTLLAVAGVVLFWHVYPERWLGAADALAFETAMLYFLGSALAVGSVFSAVATFRRRNNPQGTVTLEVIRQGETETIEVSRDRYRGMVSDGGDASPVLRELGDD